MKKVTSKGRVQNIKKSKQGNMYSGARTWNAFRGCRFECTYCGPTFQRQAKRQKHLCRQCYDFTPHYHPERLSKIPPSGIVFAAGVGDISFCRPEYTRQIIEAIKQHNRRNPHKTYYLQSKRPEYFQQFLGELPANVILVTTLETNRDEGYSEVSKAPAPTERYQQFKALEYPRKVITAEPLMDFDLDIFAEWIIDCAPEYVWLGYNSHPESVNLPEPSEDKVRALIGRLSSAGVTVKGKTLRGITI